VACVFCIPVCLRLRRAFHHHRAAASLSAPHPAPVPSSQTAVRDLIAGSVFHASGWPIARSLRTSGSAQPQECMDMCWWSDRSCSNYAMSLVGRHPPQPSGWHRTPKCKHKQGVALHDPDRSRHHQALHEGRQPRRHDLPRGTLCAGRLHHDRGLAQRGFHPHRGSVMAQGPSNDCRAEGRIHGMRLLILH
jgi:hypothetical protein